jgi:hypothetical protein
METLDHRPYRRDADAAGDEDAGRGGFIDREIVARGTDGERLAGSKRIMQIARAAASLGLSAYRDHVAMSFRLRIDQRIAAGHAVRQREIDVGAGREGWQIRRRLWTQFNQANVRRYDRNGFHLDLILLAAAVRCIHLRHPRRIDPTQSFLDIRRAFVNVRDRQPPEQRAIFRAA